MEQIALKIREVTQDEVLPERDEETADNALAESRKEDIKRIIRDIHAGKDIEKIKREFSKILSGIGAHELAQVEQAILPEPYAVPPSDRYGAGE